MDKELQALTEIRDYTELDKPFIMSTFLQGLYHGDSWFSEMPRDLFMANYKGVVEALIQRNTVKVVCLREDQDVIIAYSILSNDFQSIMWVFVKKAWRLKGVARSILPRFPTAVTHLTKLGRDLLKEKFPDTIFNPFIL